MDKSQLSDADQERYRELFDKLDSNRDGKVEFNELVDGLKLLKGVADQDLKKHAQVWHRHQNWSRPL